VGSGNGVEKYLEVIEGGTLAGLLAGAEGCDGTGEYREFIEGAGCGGSVCGVGIG